MPVVGGNSEKAVIDQFVAMTAPVDSAEQNTEAASSDSVKELRSRLLKVPGWLIFNVNMTSLVDMTSFNLYHFEQGASVLDVMTGKKLLPTLKRESCGTRGRVAVLELFAAEHSPARQPCA